MAKHDDAPIPYVSRVRDTKGVAQRLDLEYLQRPERTRVWRARLMWGAPAAAALLCLPFLFGIGRTRHVFSNGPVSRPHAIFENKCSACHAKAFASVPRQACLACHDGPAHPAKTIDTARLISEPDCTGCHIEHRGGDLREVANGNCTHCHAALNAHATGVRLKAVSITAFRPAKHPDFEALTLRDERPIRLNHAIHMPASPKVIRGMKLPMRCVDCHATSASSPKGDLEPVTFDRHCASCHKRELEFLLPGLPVAAPPAPHTKDAPAIRKFILETYQALVSANPAIVQTPLDRGFTPEPSSAAWVAKAARLSEEYLFEKKCKYCHEYEGMNGEFPVIAKVNRIHGRYERARPDGEPWLARAEFSHRSHRAVECSSCHAAARGSMKTSDVLIPAMKTCGPCHGASGANLDRCSTCHLYHNKTNERDRDRRPVEQLIGAVRAKRPYAD